MEIIKAIEEGIKGYKERKTRDYLIIPDRREAIYKAIGLANKDDIVVIAGKGLRIIRLLAIKKYILMTGKWQERQ